MVCNEKEKNEGRTMNLINDQWIPVIRENGQKDIIAPWQIAETDNPVIEINAPRFDFQGALYQFLIGLIQTTYAPEDTEEWIEIWDDGIELHKLETAFESVADVFELYRDEGVVFMQDLELNDGEEKPISSLLIEAPGCKTIKDNLDHFVKRNTVSKMCSSCVASALFTMQLNAPSGGSGHRVGLRGGGPLTTLILSENNKELLWRKIWLNILDKENIEAEFVINKNVFPWKGKTVISDKAGTEILPNKENCLQAYWGMPRRFRLKTPKDDSRCDLCDSKGIAYFSYLTKNKGFNYGDFWLHPLTPYQFDPKKIKPPLSKKGQKGGLGYKDWLSLTLQNSSNGDKSAKIVALTYDERIREISKTNSLRLWCFGYDMDNMKARCWYEQMTPLLNLSRPQQVNFVHWVGELILSADDVRKLLKKQIKEAWCDRPGDLKGDLSIIDKSFWQATENKFYDLLNQLNQLPETTQFPSSIYKQWLSTLYKAMMQLFERWTLDSPPEDLDLKRIVLAKQKLQKMYFTNKNIKTMKARSQTEEVNSNE